MTDRTHVDFILNGRKVVRDAQPRMLLTDFLRHEIGLTGTHVGCEHGVCGACTIRIDGELGRACLMLAHHVDGRSVQTIEGLEEGNGLSPVQAALRDHHGLQCGFCTPGIAMTLTQLFDEHTDVDEALIDDWLGGHLCRCTGYEPIRQAALAVARGDYDRKEDL